MDEFKPLPTCCSAEPTSAWSSTPHVSTFDMKSTVMYRRKLVWKARIESGFPYYSFKR